MKLFRNWNPTVNICSNWIRVHTFVTIYIIAMVKFNELANKAIASAHDPHKVRTKDIEEAAQNV